MGLDSSSEDKDRTGSNDKNEHFNLDDLAKSLRHKVRCNTLDVADAKQQIASVLVQEDLPEQAVNTYLAKDSRGSILTPERREDVISGVREALVKKVLQPANEGGLDLFHTTGTSGKPFQLGAWAFMFSKSVARSVVRQEVSPWEVARARVDAAAVETPERFHKINWSPSGGEPTLTHDETHITAVLKDINFSVLRGAKEAHTLGRVLSVAFGVPLPARILDISRRQKMFNVLQKSPRAASRSVYQELHGEPSKLPIWEGFSDEDLMRINSWPPEYSTALAHTAIGPWPRPAAKQIPRFASQLREKGTSAHWRKVATDLAYATAAICCEQRSPYARNPAKQEAYEASIQRIRESAEKFPLITAEASQIEGSPLGRTREEVEVSVQKILEKHVPVVSTTELEDRLSEYAEK